MKVTAVIATALLMSGWFSSAQAIESFDLGSAVTMAELSASVAHVQVNFDMSGTSNSYGGNEIGSVNMTHSVGIIGINQNSGIGANNMQTITMTIGSLTVTQ